MAEAEDVITDVARHATVFSRNLWRQHRASAPDRPSTLLTDVAPRLDLLIEAVFGISYRLRTAQAPARPTLLAKTFQPSHFPKARTALPATDGHSIWLPSRTGLADATLAMERFRAMALVQAMRASRGSAAGADFTALPLVLDIYLLMEAIAADAALARLLPGMTGALNNLRGEALASRPPLARFPAARRPLEAWVRALMAQPCEGPNVHATIGASPEESRCIAQVLAVDMVGGHVGGRLHSPLFRDAWTGDLRRPDEAMSSTLAGTDTAGDTEARTTRSARLARRPEVREGTDQEDEARPGAWMVPPDIPHEQAEDPFGLQRPTDRDQAAAADEFADDIRRMHTRARSALRLGPIGEEPPAFYIPCPADLDTGALCGHRLGVHRQPLPLDGQRPLPVALSCPRCGSFWTTERLMLVAVASGARVELTVDEAMTHYSVSRATIYRMVDRGELKRGRLGRVITGAQEVSA